MHEIRLAAPWDVSTEAAPEWTRTNLPFAPSAIEGMLRLRRKFHRPSGLTSESRVYVAAVVEGACEIELNGVKLSLTRDQGECIADISTALNAFNVLQVIFSQAADSSNISNVRLRIIEPTKAVRAEL